MKRFKMTALALTLGLCLPMFTACGNANNGGNTTASGTSGTASGTESSVQESGSGENTASKMHTLTICDSLKNDSIKATFINSVSGATADVDMTKDKETDGYYIYTCQADTELYNMVHLNYGNNLVSKDVAFNSYVSGWYLKDEPSVSYDVLLPYTEGMDLSYDPKFETVKLSFGDTERTVYVWTPADYDAKSSDKYSTIYAFDGQSVLATGIDRGMESNTECWNISESVEGMMSLTDNKTIIVAIVTNGAERDNELIPDLGELYVDPDVPEEYRPKSEKTGIAFAGFVCDTVMPYVQEEYNVYTDAQHNFLVGSSYGGLESFYTVLTHPDKFGTCGALSSSFELYDEATWDTFLSNKIYTDNAPFLYLYAGRYGFDGGSKTEMMYKKLTDKGYPKDKLIFSKYERGSHLMIYWRNIFSEFLQAAFMQRVEALEFGAKVEYIDRSEMKTNTVTEISLDENDPRLQDKNNYIYYDNSETKWEKVCAFWWGEDDFASNIITGSFYEFPWSGKELERIGDSDIYRVIAPDGATSIIFNCGVTDEEAKNGVDLYQTDNIVYKTNENRGMVYKIDMSQAPRSGKGVEKNKHLYKAGEWKEYNG